MTTTCTACGAEGQSGAFCSVCGTPTVAAGLGPSAMSARLEVTTEPEARGLTRQSPGVVRGATPVGGGSSDGTLPLAGVGRRVGAYVLDVVALSLVVLVVATVVAMAVDLPGRAAALGDVSTEMGAEAAAGELFAAARTVSIVAGLVGVLGWVGLAVWEGRTGATVGNRLLGIRTHAADPGRGTAVAAADAPLGVGRALLRWLMLALAGVVPVVGIVLMLLSPLFDASGRRQGWHDKVAGSVVHDVRGAPPRSFAPASAARPAAPAAAPAAPAAPAGTPAPASVIAAASPEPTSSVTALRPLTPGSAGQPAGAVAAAAGPASGDPWDFPSGGRSAPGGGLITGVPGLGGGPERTPTTGPVAAEPTTAAAPVVRTATSPVASADGAPAAPAGPETFDAPVAPAVPAAGAVAPDPMTRPEPLEDLEATRFGVSSRRSTGEGVSATPATTIDLPSGRRVRIDSRTLLGRNPQRDGSPATLLRVDDPSRSVSKTHLELVPTPDGLRVTDLGSTNGTAAITPAGEVRELAAGVPATVATGWAVQAGDLRFTVAGPVGP